MNKPHCDHCGKPCEISGSTVKRVENEYGGIQLMDVPWDYGMNYERIDLCKAREDELSDLWRDWCKIAYVR